MVDENRNIVVVTADAVEDTGTVSFKFMIDADIRSKIHQVPPQMWGWVWKPDPQHDDGLVINVFKGGSGISMSGPLNNETEGNYSESFFQEVWDSIPSCCILMTTTIFEWFKEAAKKYGLEFTHIHHEGFLKTSSF